MVKELDTAVLTTDWLEEGLRAGDLGTVVLVHRGGMGYEVEFTTLRGETITVVSLHSSQVRPIGRHEIAHARPVEQIPA